MTHDKQCEQAILNNICSCALRTRLAKAEWLLRNVSDIMGYKPEQAQKAMEWFAKHREFFHD